MRSGRLLASIGGLAFAVTAVAGCTTFQLTPTTTRGGYPPVSVKSVTGCPGAAYDYYVLLEVGTPTLGAPPGTYGFTDDPSKPGAWSGLIPMYKSVVQEPMEPSPTMKPGTYLIQPYCRSYSGKTLQVYDSQQLHVLPALTFTAPTSVRRGNAIRLSGAGCIPGNTVLAGALLVNQPWYAWNDSRLVKYFNTTKADQAGRWSVSVTIPATAHTGPYRLRAECQFSNGAVTTGYSAGQLTVGY